MPSLQEIPARQGRAVKVERGQALQIINTFGHQVVDFWAFDAGNLRTYLSMEHTRAALSRLTPRAGDILVDNRREPMLEFEADTSPGVHDLAVAACPASFNLWMNIPVLPTGDLEWRETVARPGDSVTFRALVDCIMVMSACPQDVIRINSGRPASAQYAVLAG
jgi:uncharacterized protein